MILNIDVYVGVLLVLVHWIYSSDSLIMNNTTQQRSLQRWYHFPPIPEP